jgi:transposase
MNKASTIGLDLAKQVFQVHGADATGAVVFRKRLRRAGVLQFFASQAPCRVAMEACASSHYWGRELSRLGHEVRLIPPAYVKPFVKRQKNDAADAEAICEASQRPTMRFVQIKSEAAQAAAVSFEPAISWCASAHKSSMPYAVIWPSSGWSSQRGRLVWAAACGS